MALPNDVWQIWRMDVPEEGPTWQYLVMTLTSESAAIGLCTVIPPSTGCAFPGAEIWHIQYVDGIRTATQVTY